MVFEKILGRLLKTLKALLPMNKVFKRYYLLAIFASIIVSSCTSVKNITIELPKKAQQELPQNIQSLVLINRTVDSTYTDLRADSLQYLFFAKGFNTDTVIKDVQAADTLLKAMGDLLFESGRYDIVIPEDRFVEHSQNAFLTESLNWEDAKQLCEDFNTNAVLSVDMFKTRVVTQYETENYFNTVEDAFYSVSGARMAIEYEALFRVYDPANEKVILREFMRDTLIWEDMAGSAEELFQTFTPVKRGLTEASIALALDFTEKIGTSWIPERRTIFTSGDDKMEAAALAVDKGDWPSAEQLWTSVAEESSSKKAKAQALYNLAVAAEIRGDVDAAIAFGVKSYETMYHQRTYDYLERLKYRKLQLENQNK